MVSQKKTRMRRSKDGIARQLMRSEEIEIDLEGQDVVRPEESYSPVEIISIDTDGTYQKRGNGGFGEAMNGKKALHWCSLLSFFCCLNFFSRNFILQTAS